MASSSEYCCCTGPSPNRGCQWAQPASASPADNNEEEAATLEKHQTFGFFGVPEKFRNYEIFRFAQPYDITQLFR